MFYALASLIHALVAAVTPDRSRQGKRARNEPAVDARQRGADGSSASDVEREDGP
jgi:hypothetical protein